MRVVVRGAVAIALVVVEIRLVLAVAEQPARAARSDASASGAVASRHVTYLSTSACSSSSSWRHRPLGARAADRVDEVADTPSTASRKSPRLWSPSRRDGSCASRFASTARIDEQRERHLAVVLAHEQLLARPALRRERVARRRRRSRSRRPRRRCRRGTAPRARAGRGASVLTTGSPCDRDRPARRARAASSRSTRRACAATSRRACRRRRVAKSRALADLGEHVDELRELVGELLVDLGRSLRRAERPRELRVRALAEPDVVVDVDQRARSATRRRSRRRRATCRRPA